MDALPAPPNVFLAPHPNPAGRARYGRATRAPNVLPRPSPWPCGPSPLWTRYPRPNVLPRPSPWPSPLKGRGKWPGYNRNRGVEQRQLVGLITRRSSVRIRPPQPLNRIQKGATAAPFLFYSDPFAHGLRTTGRPTAVHGAWRQSTV